MTGLMIVGMGLALAAILGFVSAPRMAMAQGGTAPLWLANGQAQTGGDADESESADPTWASFMRAL